MGNFIMGMISLSIGVIMFASVFMYTLKNTSTTLWSASEIALWGVMGIAGVAGMIYGVLNVFGIA